VESKEISINEMKKDIQEVGAKMENELNILINKYKFSEIRLDLIPVKAVTDEIAYVKIKVECSF
jgi:hypothetical protein